MLLTPPLSQTVLPLERDVLYGRPLKQKIQFTSWAWCNKHKHRDSLACYCNLCTQQNLVNHETVLFTLAYCAVPMGICQSHAASSNGQLRMPEPPFDKHRHITTLCAKFSSASISNYTKCSEVKTVFYFFIALYIIPQVFTSLVSQNKFHNCSYSNINT